MKISILAFCVLFAVTGCSPDSVGDISSRISNVSTLNNGENKPIGEITLEFKSVWNSEAVLLQSGMEIKEVCKKLVKHFPDKYSRVRFPISVPTTDAYGNSNQEAVISLSFAMSDLKRMNYDKILYQQLLDFSSIVYSTDIGDQVGRAWCFDGNQEWAPNLCGWF